MSATVLQLLRYSSKALDNSVLVQASLQVSQRREKRDVIASEKYRRIDKIEAKVSTKVGKLMY